MSCPLRADKLMRECKQEKKYLYKEQINMKHDEWIIILILGLKKNNSTSPADSYSIDYCPNLCQDWKYQDESDTVNNFKDLSST